MRDLNELEIRSSHKPVTQEDIREFEKAYNIELPKDYIKLLSFSNGGHPRAGSYPISIKEPDNIFEVDKFYFLDSADKDAYSSLWKNMKDSQPQRGSMWLPIAQDGGGNEVLLSLSSNTQVFVTLHDPDEVISLGCTFEEFIDALYIDPETDF